MLQTNDQKLNSAKNQIRAIKMTSDEKIKILNNILKPPAVLESAKNIQRSPYFSVYSLALKISKSRLAYVGVFSCFVFVLGSGAIFASAGSLPGNVFYPIKVKFVEPLQNSFISSPVEKVKYQNSLVVKRFVEAETLGRKGELNDSKEDQINTLLEKHISDFNTAIVSLREVENHNEELDINNEAVIDFQATLNAHAHILNIINNKQNDKGEYEDTEISKTAKKNIIQTEDLKTVPETKASVDKQKQKRKDVQSLIDKTTLELKAVSNSHKLSESNKKNVVDHTNKTLDQARKLLQELDGEDNNGLEHKNNSHQKLLDSESSAKEAHIFLNTGLGL